MRLLLALALLALLPACAAPAVGEPIPGGGSTPLEPTLTSLSVNVFVPRCAAAACHDEGGTAPNLATADAAWLSMVNVPSFQADNPPRMVVEPGGPDQSYLTMKLRGTHAALGGGSGEAMPTDEPLPDDQLAAIEAWIASGAPND